ncbi:MAG: SAM-dependent chlorinase/fluorinase [Bacteroidales bacterium]|nr:SAM-dependent chlorinase/fluorinase [Bacteroidales bacterium]
MQIVTLTTDWGQKDWYNGQIKGLLYSTIKDVTVVDLNHNIDKFDLRSAAFVVKNSCMNFPEGTIHIIDVNTYEDKDRSFIAVKYNNQYYICTDNGLPSMVFEGNDVEITDFTSVFADSNYYTFAVLDVFAKVAQLIAQDKSAVRVGNRQEKFAIDKSIPQASIFPTSIACQVIYIDDYGNAYLNIDDVTFEKALAGRNFELRVDADCTLTRICASYQDATIIGKALLTVSSTHNLELAVREDNFSRLLGYEIGSKVIINIK